MGEIFMTTYKINTRSSENRWRHDHNDSMTHTVVRSANTQDRLDYRFHEIAHWLAGHAHGAEAEFVTNQTMLTDGGFVPAAVRWERVADEPLARLITTLAGEAMDTLDGIEPSEGSHDRANVRHLADAYAKIFGGTADEAIEIAWQLALDFCREHEGKIRYLGDWLGRAGTISGLALRIRLNRIDKEFNASGKKPKRKKKDIFDGIEDDDDLDATMASQETDTVEETQDQIEAGARTKTPSNPHQPI
jgi:hypothetical protein